LQLGLLLAEARAELIDLQARLREIGFGALERVAIGAVVDADSISPFVTRWFSLTAISVTRPATSAEMVTIPAFT
jgi:hypothetical protein